MRFAEYFLLAGLAIALALRPNSTDVSADLLIKKGPSIVKLTPPGRMDTGGTGFFLKVGERVLTITNSHVCEIAQAGRMTAWTDEGNSVSLRVLQISETTDLCALEAPPSEYHFPVLSLADYQHRFERLYVVGHPLLLDNVVSSGYVIDFEEIQLLEEERTKETCLPPSRSWMDEEGCIRSVYAFNTSIVIYPGNSGSPVMTRDGQVVGVMFAGRQATNYGAFIPFNDLKDFVKGVAAP